MLLGTFVMTIYMRSFKWKLSTMIKNVWPKTRTAVPSAHRHQTLPLLDNDGLVRRLKRVKPFELA